MTWVLILSLLSGNGMAVMSHEFATEAACKAAGETHKAAVEATGYYVYVAYSCTRRMRYNERL
jgi:hypothetical protein